MNRGNWVPAAETALDQCRALELNVTLIGTDSSPLELAGPKGESIFVNMSGSDETMVEQIIRQLDVCFDELPLLVRGESKEVRLLTPKISVARLIPSVYSFTNNRYGLAPGTDLVRARFSAKLFRRMALWPGRRPLAHAFLGLIETPSGPLLAEHLVDPGNIEVRVKRYHIGSPVHRYRYTSRHSTAYGGPPLERWTRFDRPVVCFDWRNPLRDENGGALADEPLSDDYASVWIDDVPKAKQLARDTFEWIEDLFSARGLRLIDICFFIDRTGQVIFGEISPDCMRVRSIASDEAEALDKDQWRNGSEAAEVTERYERLYSIIFDGQSELIAA